ncbi:hypothetical protein Bca4012_087958 [Brassica carinata]
MEARRLSAAAKGKKIATDLYQAPRTGRIQVEEYENAYLTHKHALTLIGRVTNPSAQKVWAVIAFFTEHWKTERKIVGADLGQGLFQFQFELETDLLAVQGIPVHLWTEDTIRRLGEDIGVFEEADITSLAVRMRVHINGRLPLIKESVIEYKGGSEVIAHFVYEKLEKHCSMCQCLVHELRDCLDAKARKRDALKEKEEAKERLEVQPAGKRHRQNREVNFRTSGAREYDRRRPSEIENYSRRGRDSHERNKYPPRHHPYARSMRDNSRDSGSQQHSSFFQRHVQTSYQPHRNARSTRSQGFGSHREGNEPSTEPARNRAELSPLVGGAPPTGNPNSVPKDAVELAIVEVREAMAQYTACADPTEGAARKERMRLAEAQGEIEETAIRMVQASKGTTPAWSPPVEIPARILAVLRLGPSTQEETRTDGNPEPPTKRKPGRPPGKRRTQESPLKLTGPLAAKRRVSQKAQPGKRRTAKGTTQTPRGANGGKDVAGGSKGQARQSNSSQSYENQPISSLLPPKSKRKMDFHNPSTLVP